MDNSKHQFTLECYSKMAKAREDLRSLLDVIGLPIEALCIDASRNTYNVRASDVVEELRASGLPDEKKDSLTSLVKNFKDERGHYADSLISLAFDIIGSVSTLRNEAHGLEAITHRERSRMRMNGTALRNYSDMADNKDRFKECARSSLSMFKDTFRETFKRSANYISWRTDFEAVASSEVGFAYTCDQGERHLLEAGKAEFVATSNSMPPCNPVFHFPQYWYQHCIRKNMETLWRDSNSYTVTVSGKLWMPLKLKKVEHPYYADEPHRQAYKCKLLRVQSLGKSGWFSAEIREGWLVADVREGSEIVMAFNEDFRKADRQLSTKVTTDVVDSLDI